LMEKGTLASGAKWSAMGTRGANEGVGVPFPGAASHLWCQDVKDLDIVRARLGALLLVA
jgi:hypothetical protein